MRLSTVGRYALRAMVDLAAHSTAVPGAGPATEDEGATPASARGTLAAATQQVPVLRQEIAERQEISSHYLAQLLSRLRKAGLVESVLGPGGGYVLAHPATEISAGDILRAVGECLIPVHCVDPRIAARGRARGAGMSGAGTSGAIVASCHRMPTCSTYALWRRLARGIAEILDSVTLAELAAGLVELPEEAGQEGECLGELPTELAR